MEKYTYKLKHDNGTIRISTVARNAEAAKKIIMEAEGCPERSMTLVKNRK